MSVVKIEEILKAASVIPVLEISSLQSAAPLARALSDGGLRVVELTLRTDCALGAIAAMKDAAPKLIIGMGTIRTRSDIDASIESGADFLVSPGASLSLLKALADCGAPALPGVATPSEAMTAYEAGFNALKFFPAEPAGAIAYLKSLAGPLPDMVFCPTGAISADKAGDYLALANVACVGGSWIATKAMIAKSDWRFIEQNARRAANMAR